MNPVLQNGLSLLSEEWQSLAELRKKSPEPSRVPNVMQCLVWDGYAECKRDPITGPGGVCQGEITFLRLIKN